MNVRLLWEPRDLWWGVFWDFKRQEGGHTRRDRRVHWWHLRVFVCIVPMVPCRITIERSWVKVLR